MLYVLAKINMVTKKVLWVNKSFLDYRVPFYEALNTLLNNHFSIVYSANAVNDRVNRKIKKSLGPNAYALEKEKEFKFGKEDGFSNRGLSLSYPKGLIRKLISTKPDIIISEGFGQWTIYSVLCKLLLKSKLWISYERTLHTERNCPKWRTNYRKFINFFVDGYLINGVETEMYLKNLGVKNKKMVKGCMSADSEKLSKRVSEISLSDKGVLRKNLEIEDQRIFLFVGQIIERKGLKYLLESWDRVLKKNDNAELLIIGEGGELSPLKSDFSHQKSIKFIGSVNYDDIYKYYAISDIFILPTLEDNWSLVIPEAMACGLPVVTSIYNGCHKELVENNKNGLVFDPLDKESIDNMLKILLTKSKTELHQMGEHSKNIESNYTPLKAAKRVFEGITK